MNKTVTETPLRQKSANARLALKGAINNRFGTATNEMSDEEKDTRRNFAQNARERVNRIFEVVDLLPFPDDQKLGITQVITQFASRGTPDLFDQSLTLFEVATKPIKLESNGGKVEVVSDKMVIDDTVEKIVRLKNLLRLQHVSNFYLGEAELGAVLSAAGDSLKSLAR